jgi:hypothetical protein
MTKPFHGYDLEDLRWRPIEHVIENLPLSLLAQASGSSKGAWAQVRRGERSVTDEEAAQIRRFLERSAA